MCPAITREYGISILCTGYIVDSNSVSIVWVIGLALDQDLLSGACVSSIVLDADDLGLPVAVELQLFGIGGGSLSGGEDLASLAIIVGLPRFALSLAMLITGRRRLRTICMAIRVRL